MKILKEELKKLDEIEEERKSLRAEFERTKKEYQNKLAFLDQKKSKVRGISRYSFAEAIKIICYLVSLVEGKKYTYHERELPLKEYTSGSSENFGWTYVDLNFYDHPSFRNKITLQYICCDEKAAQEEIDSVINEAHAMGVSIYNSKPLPLFYKMLTEPAKNYIQINTNNGHSDFFSSMNGCIEFICNDDFDKNYPITLININSKICDPDFMYIVDFMNFLSVMKLEKENFTLTQEEMMAYAREFAEEVKMQKNNHSNKKLKKVIVEV